MPEYPLPANRILEERNTAIVTAYLAGDTLERIAANFGVSIARVHQIVTEK